MWINKYFGMVVLLLVTGPLLISDLSNIPKMEAQGTVVTVNPSIKYQMIDGFGGACQWYMPDEASFDKLFDSSSTDWLGTSILRVGALFDMEHQNDDGDPDHFNWSGFNFNSQAKYVPCINAAKQGGVTVNYYIESVDTVGNSEETSTYSYTVKAEEPPPITGFPIEGIILGLALVTVFLLRKRPQPIES